MEEKLIDIIGKLEPAEIRMLICSGCALCIRKYWQSKTENQKKTIKIINDMLNPKEEN